MDKRVVLLRNWGCDIDGVMERMLQDEEFYIECLQEFADDSNFERLTKALEEQDIQEAFDRAHTLKGVLINLGLTPMYEKVVEIVEPLRAGNGNGLLDKNGELLKLRDKLNQILSEDSE